VRPNGSRIHDRQVSVGLRPRDSADSSSLCFRAQVISTVNASHNLRERRGEELIRRGEGSHPAVSPRIVDRLVRRRRQASLALETCERVNGSFSSFPEPLRTQLACERGTRRVQRENLGLQGLERGTQTRAWCVGEGGKLDDQTQSQSPGSVSYRADELHGYGTASLSGHAAPTTKTSSTALPCCNSAARPSAAVADSSVREQLPHAQAHHSKPALTWPSCIHPTFARISRPTAVRRAPFWRCKPSLLRGSIERRPDEGVLQEKLGHCVQHWTSCPESSCFAGAGMH
jgi:hypothetical protein